MKQCPDTVLMMLMFVRNFYHRGGTKHVLVRPPCRTQLKSLRLIEEEHIVDVTQHLSDFSKMSCRLDSIAEFDIPTIEEHLSSEDQSCSIESSSLSNRDSASKPSVFKSLISLSPFGEIAVVANERSAVVLTAKWDYGNSDEDQPQETYKVSSNICISHEDRGNITAVLCLPLVFCGRDGSSRRLENDITVDWTCIAIGFSSGYVNFYDEVGNLLFFKQPYNEPIVNLKCQSFQPADQAKFQDEYAEEIYVQYKSVLVRVPGSVLFQMLREHRSYLAKVAANVSDSSDVTPINYKIWKFTKQECIADCEVVGPSSSGLFDHLRCASLLGGFHAKYQAAPPKTTQLVACGSNDFVGFHYFFEGVSGPTDWRGVTTALANSVFGFLSSKTKSSKPNQDVVTTDELVNRWFSITDPNREGRCIIRSPNREYLAVTDNLGRVCLIDSARGTVVRVFKGYRGAQCGWLAVEDESRGQQSSSRSRGVNRTVVYLLIIYSARTGRLEIWPVPVGSPVAVLDAGKNGRLIYTPHRLVGVKNQKVNWSVHKWRSCTFLNSEGKLFDILVPFYCVLSEGEDRQYARDSFLLRKLRHFLRETNGSDEEVAQEVGLTAAELKSTSGMLDCVKLLSTSRNTCPEAVEAAVSVFIDRVSLNRERQSDLLPSEQSLLTKSLQLRNLTCLYKFVRKQENDPPDYFSVVAGPSMEQDLLSNQLFISRREISNLRMRLAMKLKRSTDVIRQEPVVTFKEKHAKSTFTKFLSCFDIGREAKNEDGEDRVFLSLNLSSGQPPNEKVQFLNDLLFRDVVFSSSDLSKFREEVLTSGISPIDLTLLAVHFWLDTDLSNVPDKDMVRFAQVIGIICHMEAESKVASNYNEISAWWNEVRDVLMASTSPLNALTAALACRSVAIRIECQIDAQYIKSAKLADDTWSDSDDSFDAESCKTTKEKGSAGEWEAMSADRTQWNLLIGLLEDVTILDCILSRNPQSETKNIIGTPLPMLPYTKLVISLSNILRNGTGSVSQLVARWLASSGIVAKSVVDSTDVEWQSFKERSESKRKKKGDCDIPATFFEDLQAADVVLEGKEAFASQCLRILKWHFPFSLTGSVLLMELSLCYFNEWDAIFTKKDSFESGCVFDGAMSCLSHLPSLHIRKGLCIMVWNSFIWTRMIEYLQFFENPTFATARGRPITLTARPQFVDWFCFSSQCLAFNRLFLEVSEICDFGSDVEVDSAFYQHEDLWESNREDILPSSTLSRALSMRNWKNLPLSLTLQIASVMEMMIKLDIQITNCMKVLFGGDLFYRVVEKFTENMDPALFNIKNSDILARPRYNFLISVVEEAYRDIRSMPLKPEWSAAVRSCMENALCWMSRCEELVSFWHLDYDELRRYQVCLLYCAGLDFSAEEILPAVREKEKLASSLLNIVRRRFILFLEHSPHISENISLVEPAVGVDSSMLGLDTDKVRHVDLTQTLHLLRYVLGISPSSKGTMLLHAIESIITV